MTNKKTQAIQESTIEKNSESEYFEQGEKASIVGIVGNVLLTVAKMVAGIMGHSTAMIADSAHSASDIVASAVVYISLKIVKKPADKEHQYGHGKAESLACVLVGVFLLLAGFFIAFSAIKAIKSGDMVKPGVLPLLAAILSIVVKEAMFQYTYRIGKKIGSPSTIAVAWDHRSDAYSSIASLIGIVGARFGFLILDPIAGIAVTFFILKMGWNIFIDGIHQLMDGFNDIELINDVKETVVNCSGILELKDIRARQSGPYIFLNIIVGIDKNMSVERSHNIAANMKEKIKGKYSKVNNVFIHVEPVDEKIVMEI